MSLSDVNKDSVDLVVECRRIRDKFIIDIEYTHCSRKVSSPGEFENDPITCLMNAYNMKSKEIR